MKLTNYPTVIEVHDDDSKQCVAIVSTVDEGAATVEMKTVFNASTWPDVAQAIHAALQDLHLKGDQ